MTEGKEAMDLSQVPFAPYYRDEHCVIYNADCRKVLPFLPKFDLLLTDPPYGIDAAKMTMGKGQSSKPKRLRIANDDWDTDRPNLAYALESANAMCIWGGNYFTDLLEPTNDWLVWHKKNDGRSFSECEFAWTNFGKQSRHFAWSWLTGDEDKVHKTQKPLPVIRWCLAQVPDAKTVLDCYAGSLTTAVACKLENRFCVCIEINEAYCEKGVKRLEQGVLF